MASGSDSEYTYCSFVSCCTFCFSAFAGELCMASISVFSCEWVNTNEKTRIKVAMFFRGEGKVTKE